MADDRLTTLYNWSEEMTKAGESVKEKHEKDYKTMIDYVKTSDTKERILAAQLIARFFKYFPAYEESAFDSIVDLCESVDVDVRKHATMAMIAICRDCKHLVSKAADILIQLYQTKQASEVNLINQSLTTLLNLDIQKFLQSFFTNFEDGSEVVRERALKFLSTKIQTVAASALTKEIEEQLLTYSKKAMEDVTKDEFITFIGILSKLKIAKTVAGQAMIVVVIKSQAELDKDFDVNDTDSLDKFLLCTKHTIPLLSPYNRASQYVNYICTKILPHLSLLASKGHDLSVLQALAEMSPHLHIDDVGKEIDLEKCQEIVFDKLVEFLPLPEEEKEKEKKGPTEEEPAKADTEQDEQPGEEKSENQGSKNKESDFQFTHIEYLLYTFHQLSRLRPEFFSESLFNDIKLRLQHLALGCTKYMEILSAQLRSVKKGEDLKTEENKIRSVALRTTKNISIMVKDLFKKPPQLKSSVLLSCKPLTTRPIETNLSANVAADTSKQVQRGGNKQNNNNSSSSSGNNNNNSSNNNNNNNNNSGNYNKANFANRQGGQKHKYRQSYQNNKRQRQR